MRGEDPPDDELRAWLAAEWKQPVRDAEAAAIFEELGLELGRRHLLESELFRALLEREPALARAA